MIDDWIEKEEEQELLLKEFLEDKRIKRNINV